MQEKNAIKINSLPVIIRNHAASQKTSIPINIVRVQKKVIYSGCAGPEPQQLAYFPHFAARIFIVMLFQLQSRYAAENVRG
jgi:hypothetical protein